MYFQIPNSLNELPGLLANITQMLSTPSLRRSISNLTTSRRSATSSSLENPEAIRATAIRFHSTVNPPSLKALQITPTEQPATPVSVSTNGIQRFSFDISSPASIGPNCQQSFFGDAFESGVDNSRSMDLESISENEVGKTR